MKKALYNPISNDFSVTYDINGDGHPLKFVAPSMTISYFEEPIFSHVRKHLLDHILNVRNLNPTIPANRESIEKEVDVEI